MSTYHNYMTRNKWWQGWDWGVIFISAVGLGLLALLVWLIAAMVIQARSPTFELHKNEWTCTDSRMETYVYFVMVGKTMVPMTGVHDVCYNYARN